MTRRSGALLPVLLVALCCTACVGAFMFDASGARGSAGRFPFLRWAELTDAERARGCTLTESAQAGGLIELRCPAPESISRFCVYGTPPAPVSDPVKAGIYNSDGLLVGCKR